MRVAFHLADMSSSTVRQDLGVHANNCVHAKWTAHSVEVYMQSGSCFRVWLKQKIFDKKDSDCNCNPIYPTFFC